MDAPIIQPRRRLTGTLGNRSRDAHLGARRLPGGSVQRARHCHERCARCVRPRHVESTYVLRRRQQGPAVSDAFYPRTKAVQCKHTESVEHSGTQASAVLKHPYDLNVSGISHPVWKVSGQRQRSALASSPFASPGSSSFATGQSRNVDMYIA